MHQDYEVEIRHRFDDAKSRPEAFLYFNSMLTYCLARRSYDPRWLAATFIEGSHIVWRFQFNSNCFASQFNKEWGKNE